MDRRSRPTRGAHARKAVAGTARRIIEEDGPKGKIQKRVPCRCNQTMSGPGAILEMPALGRPFRLGLLYDCFRDVLLTDCSLLDPETIQKSTEKIIHTSCTMQKVSSGTIGEKAAALDIKPSLMTSLLCGLPEVNGAAKYLLSTERSRCQDKVTYQCLATERIEHLSLDGWRTEDVVFPTIPNQYKPSHVVTAVWYGEQSFLDYDKEVSTLENVEKDLRNLLLTEGKTDLQMDEVGEPQSKTHNSTFYGDSSLENHPVTFQDARKIQGSRPKLLGWSKEKSVPVKAGLFPLENLRLGDPWVPYLRPFHEISEALNSSIKHAMESLTEVETACEDFLKDPTVKAFPEIRKKIQQFQGLCCQYKQAFQKKLAEVVPLVREGHGEERDLEEVLECIRKSPFDTKGLREFLDTKQQEVTFLNSVLSVLKDVEIVCPEKKLEEKIFNTRTEFVVAFLFTSLHQEEPYLSKLEDYISHSLQLEDSSWESLSCPSWLEDKALVTRAKEAAKSFSAFLHANPSSKTTQFVVASIPDDSDPGAFIHLYENGGLSGTKFEPPSKPLPVRIGAVSPDSVQLRLTPGKSGADAICCFQVEHRVVGQENWVVEVTNGREEVATVRGLSPDTEYEFRYAAMSKPGRSENSDISSSVKTLPRSPATAPQEGDEGSPILVKENIRADERNICCTEEAKIIKGEGGINWNQQGTGRETETAEGLQTFASNSAPGPRSKGEPKSIASSLLRTSHRVRSGHPSVYALALQKSVCKAASTYLKYSLGKEGSRLHHKVIMLLGETGAGKSTLIEGMMNYILGVRWEDDFRFKAAQDMPKRSQAVSQTETLTAYEINLSQGLRVPFSLTLIDTPGFGDTRGISYDKMLLEQIREFFLVQEGFDHIDAVCVVVQASQPRLTQPQKYIFDSLLSIFGKDIQENIQVLITFADGRKPPVLEAIKAGNVPCATDAKGVPVHVSFNNSALFSSNVQAEGDSYLFNQMFWQMGVNSLDVFFRSLVSLEPRSLTMTAHVLDERKALEAVVQGMKPQIKMALLKVEELRKTQRALLRHQGDVEANRNFEYELEKTMPFKIDISSMGYSITNCQHCHITCHYPCHIQESRDKWKCAVMDKRLGRCRVCPGKCPWEVHCTQSYKWEYCVVKEKQTYAHLKEKYEKSCGKLMTEANACQWLSQECRKAEHDLVQLIKKLSHHLQCLQKIALRPNPMTTSEYLDLMISSEEEELEAGYDERINLLRHLKKQFSELPTQAY
ncbi:uncharacterized protein LOC129337996 [Eublepharis macularius]|uniref:Uncharacterized protein LOC129337996 n=1 Tax=Eublepharis macularius TaxID=481883 RepID=A0AA97K376_EUBMA|nr:uncharacterized protein LOC129337996 [Eublepharis macularius]